MGGWNGIKWGGKRGPNVWLSIREEAMEEMRKDRWEEWDEGGSDGEKRQSNQMRSGEGNWMEGDEEAAPNPTRQDLEKLREDTQANEKSGGGIVITRKLVDDSSRRYGYDKLTTKEAGNLVDKLKNCLKGTTEQSEYTMRVGGACGVAARAHTESQPALQIEVSPLPCARVGEASYSTRRVYLPIFNDKWVDESAY
ncbi:hypothetical protein C8J57DRAFT_1234122 [Mycena rebaudengoi]|nr:hypothetical protein C8J57DRAFT_1234122 [Mycena rebaudengoi]